MEQQQMMATMQDKLAGQDAAADHMSQQKLDNSQGA
jgi:hypothetical protein